MGSFMLVLVLVVSGNGEKRGVKPDKVRNEFIGTMSKPVSQFRCLDWLLRILCHVSMKFSANVNYLV